MLSQLSVTLYISTIYQSLCTQTAKTTSSEPFFLIRGPLIAESRSKAFFVASLISEGHSSSICRITVRAYPGAVGSSWRQASKKTILSSVLANKYIRRMERTLSMNYPVLRQNKLVLLYTFVKNHSLYYFFTFLYIPSIYPFLPLVLMYSDEI